MHPERAPTRATDQVARTGTVLGRILETMSDGFALYGADGRLVLCNERYKAMYPRIRDLIVPGVRFQDLVKAAIDRGQIPRRGIEGERGFRARRLAAWAECSPIEYETSEGRWIEARDHYVQGGGRICICTDVSERKRTTRLIGSYLDATPDALVIVDREGWITFANARTEAVFGYRKDELIGQSIETLIPERFRTAHRKQRSGYVRDPVARPMGTGLELYGLRKDGREFPAEVSLSAIDTGEGMVVLSAVRDVTERQQAEETLHKEKERAEITLESIGDAVITTNPRGLIEYINPTARSLTGWRADEARGQPSKAVLHLVDETTRRRARDPVTRCLTDRRVVEVEDSAVLVARDGREISVQISAAPILARDATALGAVVVFSDVTEARRAARELAHQATHDPLTGLVSRREFEHRLQRVIDTAREQGSDNALCYLDLDRFKMINDSCGHVAGDELLSRIGELLAGRVRKRDTLARLGGDEFGILLERCSLQQARRVANAVRRAIRDYTFVWESARFNVGVSIGLVPVTRASESVADVMRAADSACYRAKDRGRNCIHVHRESDAELARRKGEAQWASRLGHAIEADRFQLWFQPIEPIRGGEGGGTHYELLLRMEDEDGQIVGPNAFLPAAERHDLVTRLDRWVVQSAFEWLEGHSGHRNRLRLCEINLSARSIANREFLQFVVDRLHETAIPPEKICFDVTETAAVTNVAGASHFMRALGNLGCRFALDDFGGGLSSLAYLKNLPIDFLKIDGAFVKDVVDDPVDMAVVRSITDIGHAMNVATVAESVENAAILETLRLEKTLVDYAQGFAVGRPRPIEELA